MDILDTHVDIQVYKLYKIGLYETYLFKPNIYMPLVYYSKGRIDYLTWRNLWQVDNLIY